MELLRGGLDVDSANSITGNDELLVVLAFLEMVKWCEQIYIQIGEHPGPDGNYPGVQFDGVI